MRLVTRLTAATALAGLLVFGAYGGWLIAEERRDLRAAVERELLFLGTSLRVGVENALRDRQLVDVEEATLRLEGVDTAVDIFIFDPRGAPVVAPTGLPAGELGAALAALVEQTSVATETRIAYHPPDAPEYLLLATPLLTDDGDPQGELAIVRPLGDINEDLLATSGAIATTVGGFVLLATGLGLVIGHTRLRQPLEALLRGMRRVRSGELGGALPEAGDEEIADLASEFNRMQADLQAARRQAQEEAEARRDALLSLQAADRLITVGQLSAAVAHEIGSPLQVLHGRARALAERPDDPERTKRHAEVLVRESERITRIVSQLLALTRRRPARREPVDLAEAARQVLALLEIEARRRDVRLELDPGPSPRVVADPDQVQQVVLNLVTNALAASRPGGWVRVALEGTAAGARLVVEDNGAGMTDEVRERAFEALFTTRGEQGGTGLGLAVVRSIVQEHGGSVGCTSTLGEGSRFVVDLPAGGAGGA